jgi:hypothetical protein
MGMLPPNPKGLGAVANWSAPKPTPDVQPLDPAMQGASTSYARPRRERVSEDRALAPQDAKLGGSPAASPTGSPTGSVGAGGPAPLLTPNQYVDPLFVQRLLAKARTGYAGTFLTGPRGVSPKGGG